MLSLMYCINICSTMTSVLQYTWKYIHLHYSSFGQHKQWIETFRQNIIFATRSYAILKSWLFLYLVLYINHIGHEKYRLLHFWWNKNTISFEISQSMQDYSLFLKTFQYCWIYISVINILFSPSTFYIRQCPDRIHSCMEK